jgi:hypothetical protein
VEANARVAELKQEQLLQLIKFSIEEKVEVEE